MSSKISKVAVYYIVGGALIGALAGALAGYIISNVGISRLKKLFGAGQTIQKLMKDLEQLKDNFKMLKT